MKLTKIELNEGIKLSEVKDTECIYFCDENRVYYPEKSGKHYVNFSLQPYFIIRDNKVIPIIKDEEYNNDKPYLIKYGARVLGFITLEDTQYCAHIATGLLVANTSNLNKLVSILNKELLEVYKQDD